VCRLSGKLAGEGCNDVEVVDDEGHIEHRSMIYTEYFARGTQPTTVCELHPKRNIFGSIAAVFTGTDKPAPPRMQDTGLPPVTTSEAPVVAAEVAPLPPPEPPKKKRGFWSRVLGIGDDQDKDAKEQEKDEKAREDRDR
jgi:hypothetical protein